MKTTVGVRAVSLFKYSYDRGIQVAKLGGQMTFQGFQVFLSFRF